MPATYAHQNFTFFISLRWTAQLLRQSTHLRWLEQRVLLSCYIVLLSIITLIGDSGTRWGRLRTDRSAEWDDSRVHHGSSQFCNPNCWVKLHTAVSFQVRPSSFLKFYSQRGECVYKNSSLEGAESRARQVVETMLHCPLALKNIGPQWSQVLYSPRSQSELSGRARLL